VTSVSGVEFVNFGAHHDAYPASYLTVAAAIGVTRSDIDTFVSRFDQCVKQFQKKHGGHPGPGVDIGAAAPCDSGSHEDGQGEDGKSGEGGS